MSSSNDRPRTLLPRSATYDDAAATHPESSPTPGSSRSTAVPATRTNIRSACLACRRRRSRCSGGSPCNRCRALETDCTYNEFQDGRTRALRERSKEELDLYKKVIHGIFRAVREGREQPLMELIRQDASLDTISIAIEDLHVDSRSGSASESTDGQPMSMRGQFEDGMLRSFRNYPPELFDPAPQALGPLSASGTSLSSLPEHVFDDELLDSTSNIRFMLQPIHREDDTGLFHLSRLYISFRDVAHEIISRGTTLSNTPDVSAISCNMIFNPENTPFNLSAWASIVVNSIPGLDISFRLAWLCYLTRFMRWVVKPSQEHFDHMPEAMRPTNMQLSVPHPPVIDLVPLPQMRDLLITEFRDFTTAFELAGATVLWASSIESAIDRDQVSGELTVSLAFENHVSNLDNLYFGRNILHTFPELERRIGIAEQDRIVATTAGVIPAV